MTASKDELSHFADTVRDRLSTVADEKIRTLPVLQIFDLCVREELEERFPSVLTDEMVQRASNVYGAWDRTESMRRAIEAILPELSRRLLEKKS